jgi:hypothetical protein
MNGEIVLPLWDPMGDVGAALIDADALQAKIAPILSRP